MYGMNTAELARRLDNIVRFGVIEQTDFTTDPVQPRARVRTGDILTAWIPISAPRANTDAEHDPVQKGEHVILLAPSGELTQAVVAGKLFSADYPSPDNNPANHRRVYRDAAQFDYDSEKHCKTHSYPDGAVFTYDAENSVATRVFPDQATFIYDAKSSCFLATFPDGARITYDAKTSHFAKILPESGTVNVEAAGGIRLIGDITHEGDYTQTGNQTIQGNISLEGSLSQVGNQTIQGEITHTGTLSQNGGQVVQGVVTAKAFEML